MPKGVLKLCTCMQAVHTATAHRAELVVLPDNPPDQQFFDPGDLVKYLLKCVGSSIWLWYAFGTYMRRQNASASAASPGATQSSPE